MSKRVHIQVITATNTGEMLFDGFWLIDTGLTREEIVTHIRVTRPRLDTYGSRCFVWDDCIFPVTG